MENERKKSRFDLEKFLVEAHGVIGQSGEMLQRAANVIEGQGLIIREAKQLIERISGAGACELKENGKGEIDTDGN